MITPEQVLESPHLVGHAIGLTKLTQLHSEWIKYIWFTNESRNLQAHRGSYKTTAILSLGATVYSIFNPNERIFIFRKEFSENIKPIFREIKSFINSPALQELTRQWLGKPVEIERYTDNSILLSHRTEAKREANITGFSIGSPVTGQHADRIINDDISTLRDRVSEAERKRTISAYYEQKNIVDPSCPISTIGTPWHPQDVFSLFKNIKKYDIYNTGLKDFTKAHIEDLKQSMPPSLFAANYELKHIAAEDTLFKTINYGDWDKRLKIVGHIDAKYQGKDTGAFTMIAKKKDGNYQGIGFMFTKNIQDCINDIIALHSAYNCGTIYKENNDDKGYTAKILQKNNIPVVSYHERENKHVKIIQHLYPEWKKIYWSHDSDSEYINQILEYGEKVEPDDCADSAASLMRSLNKNKTELEAPSLSLF